MAGSKQYLALLEDIPYAAPSWDQLEQRWNRVTQWSEHHSKHPSDYYLKRLAATAFALLAKERGTDLRSVIRDAKALHIAKNAGYAGADNPDPWANFRLATLFGVTAAQGSLVRMSDKYIRIQNLRKDPSNDRVGESIMDTLADLAAYALITICLGDS